MEIEKNLKLKIIIGIVIIISVSLLIIVYIYNNKEDTSDVVFEEITTKEEITTTKEFIYVDIKGSVKKPGVYALENNSIVQDVIKKAGGLTKNAYTKNINLAQKVKNEMVIYIFSNSEIKKKTTTEIITNTECICETIEINNCIEKTTTKVKETTTRTSLVNINTASLEELMTVSGIGESKAKSIIEYRDNSKFNSIEDIKNVSGIGESLFAKIKDYITV